MPASFSIGVAATALWTAPDAPRDVDGPILAVVPDARAWSAALDKEARLGLNGRLLTQLLLGEPVEVIDERADWLQVVAPAQPSELDPRGYPGWLPRGHVAAAAASSDREAVVAVEAAPVAGGPDGRPIIRELSYGTILPVYDEGGDAVRVGLPGGRDGWLDSAACVVRQTGSDRTVEGCAVLAAARRFTGLDYMWGGMTAFGLDCSGLVHLSFRALGRRVPRDAHDQAGAATRIPLSDARPGDLYFFARPGKSIHHVGFVTGAGGDPGSGEDRELRILHAPRTGRQVTDEPIDDDRRSTLVDYAGRLADSPT